MGSRRDGRASRQLADQVCRDRRRALRSDQLGPQSGCRSRCPTGGVCAATIRPGAWTAAAGRGDAPAETTNGVYAPHYHRQLVNEDFPAGVLGVIRGSHARRAGEIAAIASFVCRLRRLAAAGAVRYPIADAFRVLARRVGGFTDFRPADGSSATVSAQFSGWQRISAHSGGGDRGIADPGAGAGSHVVHGVAGGFFSIIGSLQRTGLCRGGIAGRRPDP